MHVTAGLRVLDGKPAAPTAGRELLTAPALTMVTRGVLPTSLRKPMAVSVAASARMSPRLVS